MATSCIGARYEPCPDKVTTASAARRAYTHDIPTKIPNVQPLWIVNGRRAGAWRVRHMNPARIASIKAVKSESAIICYGQLGKNGAVFITTKKAGN
jgi:hypothetical protein